MSIYEGFSLYRILQHRCISIPIPPNRIGQNRRFNFLRNPSFKLILKCMNRLKPMFRRLMDIYSLTSSRLDKRLDFHNLNSSFYVKKRCFLFLYILCFSHVQVLAFEDDRIGAINAELNEQLDDEDRIELLLELSQLYIDAYQLSEAKQMAYRAYDLSVKNDYKKGQGHSSSLQGRIFWFIEDYKASLQQNLRALEILEELDHPDLLAGNCMNLGHDYIYFEKHDSAHFFLNKALKLYKQLGFPDHAQNAQDLIAFVFLRQENFVEAEKLFLKSFKSANDKKDPLSISAVSADLANLYHTQGLFKKALPYAEIALKASKESGDSRQIGQAYQWAEQVYSSLGMYKKAFDIKVEEDTLAMLLKHKDEAAQIAMSELNNAHEKNRILQERRDFQQRIFRNVIGVGLLVTVFFLFNSYRQSRRLEKEKNRSEELLLNILPADIAQELKNKGHADANEFEQVSVLFTDFVKFTELTQNLTPAELVAEINICFKEFDLICERYGVEKIKTIGDAYMAVGGMPTPSHASVKNTVLAALEMQKFLEEREKIQGSKNKIAFTMRAGINTGSVIAGIVGLNKFQYDIWGSAVNAASRIENSSIKGKLSISRSTYDLLKDEQEFEFEERPVLNMKGIGDVETWFVQLKKTQE